LSKSPAGAFYYESVMKNEDDPGTIDPPLADPAAPVVVVSLEIPNGTELRLIVNGVVMLMDSSE
jgi:hypothetical protein